MSFQTNTDPPTYASHMDVCQIEAYIAPDPQKLTSINFFKKKNLCFFNFLLLVPTRLTVFFFFLKNFHKIVFLKTNWWYNITNLSISFGSLTICSYRLSVSDISTSFLDLQTQIPSTV